MESLSACRLVSVLSLEKLNIPVKFYFSQQEKQDFIDRSIVFCCWKESKISDIHILTVNHSITCGFSGPNVFQTLQILQKVSLHLIILQGDEE